MSPSEEEEDPEELLKETVERLQLRITHLEQELTEMRSETKTARDERMRYRIGISDLLQLPDHLRKTMIALGELQQATADEVAEKTGRVRNLESSYLNQLERMELIEKFREGRKVYFRARYVRGPGIRRVLDQISRD